MKTQSEMQARPVIQWMGGTPPRAPSEISPAEAGMQKFLFLEQVTVFRRYWGDSPDWDTLRIFYNRARHDAHASWRDRAIPGGDVVLTP